MKSQTAFKQFVLGPGKEVTVAVTGSFFFMDSVNGDVSVRFDTGNFSRMISGSEIECQPGDYFTNITFRSDVGAGGATVTGYYYAGTLRVGNRFPVVFTRPAPTYLVPLNVNILNTETYTIPETNLRTGQTIADKIVSARIQVVSNPGYAKIQDAASSGVIAWLTTYGGVHDNEVFPTAVALKILAVGTVDVTIAAYYSLPT